MPDVSSAFDGVLAHLVPVTNFSWGNVGCRRDRRDSASFNGAGLLSLFGTSLSFEHVTAALKKTDCAFSVEPPLFQVRPVGRAQPSWTSAALGSLPTMVPSNKSHAPPALSPKGRRRKLGQFRQVWRAPMSVPHSPGPGHFPGPSVGWRRRAVLTLNNLGVDPVLWTGKRSIIGGSLWRARSGRRYPKSTPFPDWCVHWSLGAFLPSRPPSLKLALGNLELGGDNLVRSHGSSVFGRGPSERGERSFKYDISGILILLEPLLPGPSTRSPRALPCRASRAFDDAFPFQNKRDQRGNQPEGR